MEKINEDFLQKVKKIYSQEDATENTIKFGEIIEKMISLIGDPAYGYLFNKKNYDFLMKNKHSDCFCLRYYDKEEKRPLFLQRHAMVFFLFQKIEEILDYVGSIENLNSDENLVWRLVIKKLLMALALFFRYEDKKNSLK